MGCVNHIQFRAPITPEPSRVEHVAFVPAAPPSTPGDASWSPSSPAVGRFFSKDSGKSWEIVKIWWLFMGLFWYFLWGYLVWDIIKWDIMKYQWVMMMGIWWENDLYWGLNMIYFLGIWWEYDGNMMGIWWEYDGNMMGIWWEYDGNMMGIWWEYDDYGEYDGKSLGILWECYDGIWSNMGRSWVSINMMIHMEVSINRGSPVWTVHNS